MHSEYPKKGDGGPSGSLLSVRDLRVVYNLENQSVVALDGVSLDMEKNAFVAVVGESGCGKSTLALSIIGLLASPPGKITEGSIEYKSVHLLTLGERERRQYRGTEIAMIFQEPLTSLDPVYKIGSQILEAVAIREARVRGDGSAKSSEFMQKVHSSRTVPAPSRIGRLRHPLPESMKNEVYDALKRVRIADAEQVIDRYPFELSGGMRQRVMIAMALAQRPALLIADEPTTALDVTTQAQVLKLMKALMEEAETSILLITHDLAVACQVADRIIVMYAGDIVEDADVFDFFTEPMHPYSKALLQCIPTGSRKEGLLKSIPGSVPDLSVVQVGCKYASRCPYVMSVCTRKKPVLKHLKKENHKVACFLYDD
jgi:peptide/nickel transport system ATP-binding protein